MSLAMANTSLALQEVLASLRLGGSIPYGGSLYQSPFTGLLTDLNIWSRALDREDMRQLQEECRYPASGLPHLESHYLEGRGNDSTDFLLLVNGFKGIWALCLVPLYSPLSQPNSSRKSYEPYRTKQ